ncbi:hypothetical protein ACWC5C_31695 [Streptomyces sp. NPDC001700]
MLVRVEKSPQTPQTLQQPLIVRVHSPVGTAQVLWRGDPQRASGQHHVEWSVDEDIHWGHNTQSASFTTPALWQEHDHVVLRGRLNLAEGSTAIFEMGDSHILFDLAAPLPESAHGTWLEIRVAGDSIALWPYQS